LIPARIEQQIIKVLPHQELNIDSFEAYEQALDYCKQTMNVGVIFIHENCGKQAINAVFDQLAKPGKASGWPVLGAAIRKHADIESISTLKAMRDCHSLVEYYSENDFEKPEQILNIFATLWDYYIKDVESSLIPEALQDSLRSIIATENPPEEKVFYSRISEVLTRQLNLSWQDLFSVKWHYLVNEAAKLAPAALAPHKALKKIVLSDQINKDAESQSLLEITSSKKNLSIRTIEVIEKVLAASRSGKLEQLIQEAKTEARPGRPGLLRTFALESNTILAIHSDTFETIITKAVAS
jgi:hypothetical protein